MRFSLYLFLLVIPHLVQAQLFSELHLKLYDNSVFTVVIDQETYSSPSNNVVLQLFPGKHFLQVIRHTMPESMTGNEVKSLTFSGIITVPYNVTMYSHIDPDHGFNVIKLLPFGSENLTSDPSMIYPGQPLNAISGWEHGKFDFMKEESYSRLKDILKKINLSKQKLEVLKQAVTHNAIKSDQVAELMRVLDFDSERLEFAKYAYYFTSDKENFFLINDSFIFSSSVKEINKHIYSLNY